MALGLEAADRGDVGVVVAQRVVGVHGGKSFEDSVPHAVDVRAVPVAAAVHGHRQGLVEVAGVVGRGGVRQVVVDEFDRSGDAVLLVQDLAEPAASIAIDRRPQGVVGLLQRGDPAGQLAVARGNLEEGAVQVAVLLAGLEPPGPAGNLLAQGHVDLGHGDPLHLRGPGSGQPQHLFDRLPRKPASHLHAGDPLLVDGGQHAAVLDDGGAAGLSVSDAENTHAYPETDPRPRDGRIGVEKIYVRIDCATQMRPTSTRPIREAASRRRGQCS